MKYCVYGGQYGSEGKGSLAEYLIKSERRPGTLLVACGENSPNSGHTCSLGKTRNLPAASYYADEVLMGPDSAIDLDVLLEDLRNIRDITGKTPTVRIHNQASVVDASCRLSEVEAGVVTNISSTGSGSGASRALHKQFMRRADAVIGGTGQLADHRFDTFRVIMETRFSYLHYVNSLLKHDTDLVFECSQGTLLDNNWGIYPFVTSRPTLPRVAVERNGLGGIPWVYAGVFRTYPIRTGGPSGPTGGKELTFESIGVAAEIATVTKRTRRIFEFSAEDFGLSLALNRPQVVAFTHLDYLNLAPSDLQAFNTWLEGTGFDECYSPRLLLSNLTGQFHDHGITHI